MDKNLKNPKMEDIVIKSDGAEEIKDSSEELIEEASEKKVNSLILGVVTECVRLRVRKTPEIKDDNIILELPFASEILVDLKQSTEDFYKVTTAAGVEGYCMKEYVNIEV